MSDRIDVLRKALKEKNIDAFFVSNFYNILYLSGFKTLVDNEREAWLLVTKSNVYLFTDGRHRAPNHNLRLITPEKRLTRHLQEILETEAIKTLGVEGDDLKFSEFQAIKNKLSGVSLLSTERLIIRQREVKDEKEIEKISKAREVIERCLTEISKTIRVGVTEREIANKVEFWLKSKGHDIAFEPIVAIDENSAVPHYDTKSCNNQKAKNGSIILIDAGSRVKDYNSDITRMFFVGKTSGEKLTAYNRLLEVQKQTINKLKTERLYKNVDAFCRNELITAGFPSYSHSTGHGVGLEVHEYPKISSVSEDKILSHQVVTIEPGIYLPGKWGMRVEDTVIIPQ